MSADDDFDSWLWPIVRYILALTLLWALLAGVNVNGKHYGITCSNNGVEVSP